jgi:adenylate cyclase
VSSDIPELPAANEPDPPAASMLKRKLVTILSADVAEYSRLMAEDEEQTLRIFREYSRTFQALVEEHHGRIFNTAGDAILAEFTSPVEAVRCATDIQAALRTRNDQLPLTRQVKFRIGINLGDVMEHNSDLLGDGVNVAARLQGAAAPGGICISGSVYDQIRNKLSMGFESLGERHFKNIPQPVRTFTLAGTNGESQLRPSKKPPERSDTPAVSIVAALSLLVLLAGGYWAYSAYRQSQTVQSSAAPKSGGQAPAQSRAQAPAAAGPSSAPTPVEAKNAAAPAPTVDAATPAAAVPPVRSAQSELSRLMRNEEMSDRKCTDTSGDLEEIGRACAERDRLVAVLAEKGWCYENSWQRCAR